MDTTGIIVFCVLFKLLASTGAYEVSVAKQVQDIPDGISWIFIGLALVGLITTVQHIFAILQLLRLRLLGGQRQEVKVAKPGVEGERWYVGITHVNTIEVGRVRTFEKKLHSCKTRFKLKDVTVGHCKVCHPSKRAE